MAKEILKFGWKIMENKSTISRKQIDQYLSSSESDKRVLEGQLNDNFEEDALDGWIGSGLTTDKLTPMDRAFNRKTKTNSSLWRTLIGGGILVILTSLLFFLYNPSENHPTIEQNKTTTLFKEKLTKEIAQMVALPKTEQITQKEVLKDQSQQKIASEKAPNEGNEDVFFDEKILAPIPIEITSKVAEVAKQRFAAEIYLHSFKSIDYRKYRNRPEIEQPELIMLSGTDASQENKGAKQAGGQTQTTAIPYIDYLNKSLSYLNKSNWKQGLMRFNTILAAYPDDVNALFYGGLCYYNLQEYNKACVAFSTCLQLNYSNFNEEAQWYLALSKKSDGKIDDAKKLFEQMLLQNGYYAKQAAEELKKLK